MITVMNAVTVIMVYQFVCENDTMGLCIYHVTFKIHLVLT